MARLPTVTLHDGHQIRIVNAADYAVDIAYWQSRGYRRVGEERGDATDEEVEFAAQQEDIERLRRITREAPKNFEARKITVRPAAEPEPAPEPEPEPTPARRTRRSRKSDDA